MNEKIRQFLALAKQVSIHDEDHAAVRNEVIRFLQQDEHLLSAKTVVLSDTEKEFGRDVLKSFLYEHPIVSQRRGFAWHSLFSTRAVGILTVVALLVTTTGTMAYAAEGTVPGDFLYSVKVDFTEPILEKMSLSAEAKAQWNLRRVERRLREAEMLQSRKDFDPVRHEQLEIRLDKHIEVLQNRIDRLHDRLPDTPEEAENGIDIRLVEMLERHEQVLVAIESGAVTSAEVLHFTDKVRQHREHIHEKRVKFETRFVEKFGTGAMPPAFFLRKRDAGGFPPLPPSDNDVHDNRRIEHRIGSGSTASGYVLQEITISESGSHIRVRQESRTHIEQRIGTGSNVRVDTHTDSASGFRRPPPNINELRGEIDDRMRRMREGHQEKVDAFFDE